MRLEPTVRIRRATTADAPGYARCVGGLFAEDAGTRDDTIDQTWPAREAARHLLANLSDPSQLFLTAEAGTDVGGILWGRISPPDPLRTADKATLLSMYVSPPLRNRGVGTRLLSAFTDWARGHGVTRLSVTAHADNADATRFYRRHGFTPYHLTLEAGLAP
ncbi:ribosomal protein S18 acetylase RimI-like enzyme [Stackebrandtia albiflava]|uniref:Ribosomal protein S18 acetylase RimI-like enzyme n=1 Tax=Stackebrandtia albiflava TaxID=406432 RepID=A0A562V9H9_9ACTN|nr:GNAT family N-acetyltransferase [Stackebrandtia albiflava]TWJ14498.1 ribosomal protein S18 acetylase RimI-like enzyme [Stackebrandtia albiflava]